MSRSRALSSRWTNVNEELEHLLANMPMPRTRFSVKFVRYMLSSGRTYSSVWHLVDKDGNYHNIVYSQDLNQTVIVARWITLRDFYQLTGWTHLHLEDVAKCRLVFNHWRKTLKIEAGWKHFCKTLSFTTDMEIVFEFIDSDVNCVLYWLCV
ncbi:hypothetical protein GmHk_18G052738 [Glycine max]|nr:hypothetical protein GmHk_18G052738 [Glycine max]